MRSLASPPPVTRRQRVFEALGLAAIPLVGWLLWKAATVPIGRGVPPTEGLRAFFVAMLVMQLALCVWPLWGRVRVERMFRRHAALLARCPACGAAGEGGDGCVRCGFSAAEGEGWRLTAVDPFGAALMASGGAAMLGLGAMFFLGLAGAQTNLARFVLLVLGALASGLALAMLVGAAGLVRAALRAPVRFTWERRRPLGEPREVSAEIVGGPGGPTANGLDRVSASPPPDEPPPDDATPFERGLAAVFFAWARDDLAPLSRHREDSWRWPSPRAAGATAGADAYRDAAPPPDDVARSSAEAWCVSFNAHGFAEALAAVGLPPLTEAADDEAEEVCDAEWDVPCAQVARVIAADRALRAAVEARAGAVAPSAPGYSAALRAARAP